jgi:PAS domain S-box-containing protein
MNVNIPDNNLADQAGQRNEQQALYEFTNSLFRAASLTDVYTSSLRAIRRGLGCQRASVLVFDEAGVMRFEPICISDIEASNLPDELKATIRAEGIAAAAFIPLVVEGKLVGKFMTYYETPHSFSRGEIDLAVTIARQLGFGIQSMRAEEQRRRDGQSSRLLASIVESSNDAIVSKDLNGIVTSWNRGAERIFGYTAEEMVGQPIITLFPEDRPDEETDILSRIRRGERIEHYETVRRRKDGTLIDVSLTVSPLMDAVGRVAGASKVARDFSERKMAEQRLRTVMYELSHRSKNLLAVVQAMAQQTARLSPSTPDFLDRFNSRMRGLARSHDLLVNEDWRGVSLAELTREQLHPFVDGDLSRVEVDGPPLIVTPDAAQTIGLALHELATNASKYGALSQSEGKLVIEWSLSPQHGGQRFRMTWRERGGPLVETPEHSGFGRLLIERLAADKLNATVLLSFDRDGVTWTFDAPAVDIVSTS